jgi:RES domain
MPRAEPPSSSPAKPVLVPVPAGAQLWRVHPRDYAAAQFNTQLASDLFDGGRFDGTVADPFPFLYAGAEQQTALLETLVRGIPFDEHGRRLIRRVTVAGRCISLLRVTRTLRLVSLLSTEHLAAACQDEWLVQADPLDYPQTRRWASWLRGQAGTADGIVWPSRRNLGHQAFVLFGDRCADALEVAREPAVDLDDADGATWLNDMLAPCRIGIRQPARHDKHGASAPA